MSSPKPSAPCSDDLPDAKRLKTDSEERAQCSNAQEDTRTRTIHLAVVGCSHGQMDSIYRTLAELEAKRKVKIDLLICCGDFQVQLGL